ncbi:MAG TPA: hypothetical protein VLK65_00820 [Vicinamibacteria bacterium]|nr:hypothetical protein [Vicinamibacteria bacterium]
MKKQRELEELALEDLAAFIDGTMTAAERGQFLTRLDTDDDALELLAETLQNIRDLPEPESPEEPLPCFSLPEPLRPGAENGRTVAADPLSRWLPAAAMLLLALVGVFALQRDSTTLPVDELFQPAAGDLRLRGKGVEARSWSDVRGAEGVAGFRLGVELVDLHVAAIVDDRALHRSVLSRIDSIVEDSGKGSSLSEVLASADERSSEVKELEQHLESEFDPPLLAYGKWAESARIAAGSGSAKFFTSPRFREFILEVRQLNMSDYVREQIDRAEILLDQPIGPDEFRELEAVFTSIVNLSGGL